MPDLVPFAEHPEAKEVDIDEVIADATDLYPASPSFFTMPTEDPTRKAKRERAKSSTQASKAIIEKTLERLNKRIEFYRSVDSISVDTRTKPDEFMHQWEANQLTITNLRMEVTYWETELKNLKT